MILAAAALGAILGSFLNALLFRFGTGQSVMRGRSRCMRCGHALRARDLVPVLSFLYLGGRCRHCGGKISWQYPLVEAAAAALCAGIYAWYPDPAFFAFWTVAWMTLLFIFVYDLRHMIIPPSASALVALLALGYVLLFAPAQWWAGPLLALPLALIALVSRGRWMGWGDPGLELSLGWFLGLTAGLSALIMAFWIGAAVGIGTLIASKRYTMKSEVPLAPFLILGAALAFFLHVDLFQTLPLLFS